MRGDLRKQSTALEADLGPRFGHVETRRKEEEMSLLPNGVK